MHDGQPGVRGLSWALELASVPLLMFRASVVVQIVSEASIEAGEGGARR